MTTLREPEPNMRRKQSSGAPDQLSTSQNTGNRESVTATDGVNDGGKKKSGWPTYLISAVLIGAGALTLMGASGVFHRAPAQPASPTSSAIPVQYDAKRSYAYLKQLCDLGPRPSGSAAMLRQQRMLEKFFRDRGADVSFQTFQIRHPVDGSDVSMGNLVASWHPTRPKRFLICAHYDTRPFPDRDRNNKRGRFVGANDGASGTAGLMELANQMNDLPADVGVDLVAFDGEELVYEQGRDDYFLGSTFFAKKYQASPPAIRYQAGVLLDMIGDRELKIYKEVNSMKYASPVVQDIWKTARRLRVRAFDARTRHTIDDDHIPLNQIAGIPTVDLIDFDYPRPGFGAPSYWHTEQDIPENCSGVSIAAVVWVVHEWLKSQ